MEVSESAQFFFNTTVVWAVLHAAAVRSCEGPLRKVRPAALVSTRTTDASRKTVPSEFCSVTLVVLSRKVQHYKMRLR